MDLSKTLLGIGMMSLLETPGPGINDGLGNGNDNDYDDDNDNDDALVNGNGNDDDDDANGNDNGDGINDDDGSNHLTSRTHHIGAYGWRGEKVVHCAEAKLVKHS